MSESIRGFSGRTEEGRGEGRGVCCVFGAAQAGRNGRGGADTAVGGKQRKRKCAA